MTKEQKYPLAEPATYAPPQMEVIPLRGNSAMLVGSMLGRTYQEVEMEEEFWLFQNTNADNLASSYDNGWDYTFE